MEGESDESLFELADFVPEPLPEPRKWGLGAWMRRAPESRWGAQLLRIASDIVMVCDEGLTILHHNRAFLKAVGYQEGSFCGRNLVEFFGFGERADVVEVFEDWRRGHAAGMRFQASLSSKRGARPYEFRAVRSRRKGVYSYYLIGREGQKRRPKESAEDEQESIFRGLPVAAWRTDGDLRITRVFGSLWPELGAATEDLVGEVFGRRHDSLLPSFLHDVECSDTL
ncbi:MAG TPA: PAS domain S-box protein, partial [Bacteroidia bacterium]|nr:PAS domain S-box protein [Bacteroidia bacterium]